MAIHLSEEGPQSLLNALRWRVEAKVHSIFKFIYITFLKTTKLEMEPRLVVARVTLGVIERKCMALDSSREDSLSRNNSELPCHGGHVTLRMP